ncbi:hypothetical protein G436_1719 [Leptospira interrogans serovar Hardjo str. Norma]|uniref:Uncharacterized protein n=1 Tax=Leptospira interrogans serovar Hardjo str. Norma TaxID=1279460 RepID=A0A0M5L8T9_LEPIR|nr:hypothetical protein G436_1719 [Leptospira interrogans serovar Hardjo str. Norma]EKO95454.1 hypothetical protein LEP1GSC057_1176 [Leptospira interrogans str. Brem 329]
MIQNHEKRKIEFVDFFGTKNSKNLRGRFPQVLKIFLENNKIDFFN